MLKKMVIPGERIAEEEEGSEDTDDTDTASIGDIGESSNMLPSDISSPGISSPDYGIPLHLPILALMEKLKRRRIENLFIKISKVVE